MIVLQLLIVVLFVSIAFLAVCNTNLFFLSHDRSSLQALAAAESGVADVTRELQDVVASGLMTAPAYSPFPLLDTYNNRIIDGVIRDSDGNNWGSWVVTVTVPMGAPQGPDPVNQFFQYKTVILNAVGKVNGKQRSLTVQLEAGLSASRCFDYAYFMNNWGWWATFTPWQIVLNGNTGCNGNYTLLQDQYGQAGSIMVNGNPMWDSLGHLVSTAGVTAAGQIVETTSASQFGGYGSTHQQPNAPYVPVPFLADMHAYSSMATGTISVGTTLQWTGAGASGNPPNLYLMGTNAAPIRISGLVVVPGDVILGGVITGHGSLYVGRNLYLASSVTYQNPLPVPRPSSFTSASQLEAWKFSNRNADCIVYAVGKHIVLGNPQAPGWWTGPGYPVQADAYWTPFSSPWNTETPNDGHEDAGIDGMWCSANPATDLENDGKWSVNCFTLAAPPVESAQTCSLSGTPLAAQIPPGLRAIAGTGEDNDGSGTYTNAWQLPDFDFGATLTTANYLGYPGGAYASIVQPVWEVDGFMYAGGAIAGKVGDATANITYIGGEVAHADLEDVQVVTGQVFTCSHDERFSGVQSLHYGVQMPMVGSVLKVSWQEGP